MIKGCRKEMIIVKETGSPYFEEAYYIIRPGFEEVGGDIVKEAERIVKNKASGIEEKIRKRREFRIRCIADGISLCSFLFGVFMLAYELFLD